MEQTMYMHLELGEGKATATIRNLDGIAHVGLAFCSPKDQFSRKKGRMISEGRLDSYKPFCLIKLDPERRVKEQVREELERGIAADDVRFPQWARD